MARNNDATSHCIRTIKYDLLKDTDEVVVSFQFIS